MIVLKQDRGFDLVPQVVAAGARGGGAADSRSGRLRGDADPAFPAGRPRLVRNFYGGLRVKDSGPAIQLDATRSLTHGTINHGEQFLNLARRDWPTTYYGPQHGGRHRHPRQAEDTAPSGWA